MTTSTRRTFLGGLGGMLALGLTTGARDAPPGSYAELDALDFGRLEGLAARMQELAPDALQRELIREHANGTSLDDLVAAGALANARSFGGHDYTGYHCLMAMMPAHEMARELAGPAQLLPVLKVLYRSSARIQATGGRDDVLRALPARRPAEAVEASTARHSLWDAFVARDVDAAERAFQGRALHDAKDALHDVQTILRETLDVHRIVLLWRSWDVVQLTGEAHAETLLRQSIRFCIDDEEERVRKRRPTPPLRALIPDLMDDHGLDRARRGTRRATDAELDELVDVVFGGDPADAARAVARRLADGLRHEDVGEALSLAANRLLLFDPGRQRDENREKPKGSVHGASVGIHACDAARAWRNLADVSDDASSAANLIAGAHHTAGQSHRVARAAYPYARHLDGLDEEAPAALLARLAKAVSKNDQERAGAFTARYVALGHDPEGVFRTLLPFTVDADGALHAEKFYRTCREDHASARPRHRELPLIALARVCASQHGWEAPGLAEAKGELGLG